MGYTNDDFKQDLCGIFSEAALVGINQDLETAQRNFEKVYKAHNMVVEDLIKLKKTVNRNQKRTALNMILTGVLGYCLFNKYNELEKDLEALKEKKGE